MQLESIIVSSLWSLIIRVRLFAWGSRHLNLVEIEIKHKLGRYPTMSHARFYEGTTKLQHLETFQPIFILTRYGFDLDGWTMKGNLRYMEEKKLARLGRNRSAPKIIKSPGV